ncbi:MAG TPA: M13 family metallopeptidase, partial [Gemmataceae bacterium]|nr:M13 family metallopeptidase [Gemmataceae bacterium]
MLRRRTAPISLFALPLLLLAASLVPAAPPSQGIDLEGMDTSVKPHEDFYRYANGKWLDATPIPRDRPTIAIFNILDDRNRDVLHEILEEAAKVPLTPLPPGEKGRGEGDGVKAKVGAFYASGMDEKRIEEAGAKPLQEELDRIAAIKDAAGVVQAIVRQQALGIRVAFSFNAVPDAKDSKRMIAGLGQGGLTLPDRDYYLKADDKMETIRKAYRAHVEKMFILLGDALGDDPKKAAAEAEAVIGLETQLAKASKTKVEMRDPEANYHLMNLEELEADAPGVDWRAYFDGLGLSAVKEADVGQPEFCKEVGRLLSAVPLDAWKAYLRWHYLNHYADRLSTPFIAEEFQFNGTVLNGVPENRPRWKRVLEATDRQLGDALGQLYVAKAFPPEAKARAEELVKNVKAALRDDLSTLDWMSPETRQEAVKKLDAIAVKIGYPSKWRDYSGLTVDRDVYVRNVMRAEAFNRKFTLDKIGKPTDPTEWSMTPSTVNAYYNPLHNEIVFPAGILQPPFFNAQADDAVNYGAIGAVIGHELTHGFDDQGRKYDANGNLRDWWKGEDAKAFQERAARIAAQYDGYVAVDDLHVNGKLTLGENIADLGGVKIAYMAFHKSLEGKPAPAKIDGFTADQRFFLSYGQIWRSKSRPEAETVQVLTNPHSPPRFRVL